MAPVDEDALLSVDEVSRYLRLSQSKVYAMLRDGELRGHKLGKQWRFRRSAVDAWLIEQTNATAGGLRARSLNEPVFAAAGAPAVLTREQLTLLRGVWIDRPDKFVAIAAKPAGKASLAKLLSIAPTQVEAIASSLASAEEFGPELTGKS